MHCLMPQLYAEKKITFLSFLNLISSMPEESHNSQSHVQQVIFNLAAFSIVVAGMKLASEILIPFLLAIFISVIANPLVTKLRNKGLPILGAILVVHF